MHATAPTAATPAARATATAGNPFAALVQACSASAPDDGGLGRPLALPRTLPGNLSRTQTLLHLLQHYGRMRTAELARLMELDTNRVWALLKGPRDRGQVVYASGWWSAAPARAAQPGLTDDERAELVQLRSMVNGWDAAVQYFSQPRFGVFDEQGRWVPVPQDPEHPQWRTARWMGGEQAAQLLRAALRFWV